MEIRAIGRTGCRLQGLYQRGTEQADDETLCILLVDSEDELSAELPKSANETPEA